MHDRREILAATAAIALLAEAPSVARIARRSLGLQLFTVMEPLERDFAGTLARVAALGYREVETIGSFGRDPAEVRRLLDRHGLRSPSQHIMPRDLYSTFEQGARKQLDGKAVRERFMAAFAFDRVEELIAEAVAQARILGQRYVVWQIAWPSQLTKRADVDALIRALDRAAQLCERAGLRLAYHNHHQEFSRVGNDVVFDLLLRHSDPERLVFELDLAWAVIAGADPLDLLTRYPNRFRLCHLKDVDQQGAVTDAGQGTVPFRSIIPAARRAGVRHFYVEYDTPADPLATAAEAYRRLARMM